MAELSDLPDAVLSRLIGRHLCIEDVARFARVSRRLRRVARETRCREVCVTEDNATAVSRALRFGLVAGADRVCFHRDHRADAIALAAAAGSTSVAIDLWTSAGALARVLVAFASAGLRVDRLHVTLGRSPALSDADADAIARAHPRIESVVVAGGVDTGALESIVRAFRGTRSLSIFVLYGGSTLSLSALAAMPSLESIRVAATEDGEGVTGLGAMLAGAPGTTLRRIRVSGIVPTDADERALGRATAVREVHVGFHRSFLRIRSAFRFRTASDVAIYTLFLPLKNDACEVPVWRCPRPGPEHPLAVAPPDNMGFRDELKNGLAGARTLRVALVDTNGNTDTFERLLSAHGERMRFACILNVRREWFFVNYIKAAANAESFRGEIVLFPGHMTTQSLGQECTAEWDEPVRRIRARGGSVAVLCKPLSPAARAAALATGAVEWTRPWSGVPAEEDARRVEHLRAFPSTPLAYADPSEPCMSSPDPNGPMPVDRYRPRDAFFAPRAVPTDFERLSTTERNTILHEISTIMTRERPTATVEAYERVANSIAERLRGYNVRRIPIHELGIPKDDIVRRHVPVLGAMQAAAHRAFVADDDERIIRFAFSRTGAGRDRLVRWIASRYAERGVPKLLLASRLASFVENRGDPREIGSTTDLMLQLLEGSQAPRAYSTDAGLWGDLAENMIDAVKNADDQHAEEVGTQAVRVLGRVAAMGIHPLNRFKADGVSAVPREAFRSSALREYLTTRYPNDPRLMHAPRADEGSSEQDDDEGEEDEDDEEEEEADEKGESASEGESDDSDDDDEERK